VNEKVRNSTHIDERILDDVAEIVHIRRERVCVGFAVIRTGTIAATDNDIADRLAPVVEPRDAKVDEVVPRWTLRPGEAACVRVELLSYASPGGDGMPSIRIHAAGFHHDVGSVLLSAQTEDEMNFDSQMGIPNTG
jgi:hypothetical protein